MLNMKKIYALLMLALPMLGFAQTTHVVTFKVNTANITVGPNGLFAGGGVVGLANAVQLLDPDGNGVYEGSTTLTGNAGGNFGFFNSPAWDQDWNTKENLAGLPCADPANYNDRIMPTFTQDTTLLFCFGSCANDTVCPAAQADYLLTLKVNTANITVGPNGLYAGGGILGNARALQLTDADGNGVYEADTLITGQGGGNFIFLNSPANDGDWGTKESLGGLPCADPNNYDDRIMPSFGQDTTLMFCFGTCATDTVCPTPLTPVNVTFQSDRSNSPTFTDAYLSGTFPIAWNGTAYPMTDTDGDGVYTVVMSLTPGDYRYKFTADNWAIEENFVPSSMSDISCINTNSAGNTDRILTVGTSDTTLMIHAWEECGGSNIGVEEVATSFTVKPNPASDVLFIENTTGTTSSVAVYNVTGAKVMEENFEANTRLDVATLPRGMYIVRLQNEDTDSVIRISLN